MVITTIIILILSLLLQSHKRYLRGVLKKLLHGPDLYIVLINSLLNEDLGDVYSYQIPMQLRMYTKATSVIGNTMV